MSIVLWWLVSLAGRSWCQATQLALFGLSGAEILEVRGAAGNWRGRLMWGEAAAGTGTHRSCGGAGRFDLGTPGVLCKLHLQHPCHSFHVLMSGSESENSCCPATRS